MRTVVLLSLLALILASGAQAQQPPWTTEREQQLERRISDYGRWVRKLQREKRVMKRVLASRNEPVRDAVALASTVYRVSFGMLWRRATCESGGWPYARNQSSGASGLFQFLPSTWRSTPFASFSIWNPYANALAAGWMHGPAGRSGEWACR